MKDNGIEEIDLSEADELALDAVWDSIGSDLQESLVTDFPDVRQNTNFRCGAAEFASACESRGVDMTVDSAAEMLGTNVEHSTDPYTMVEKLHKLGIAAEARSGMTVADLRAATERGSPVICCIQDYDGRREPEAVTEYGHYVTVLEVTPGGMILCHDPSIENVEREPGGDVPKSQSDASGNAAAPGIVPFREADWLRIWHDQRANGEKLVRFGIVVGGGEPQALAVQESAVYPPPAVILPPREVERPINVVVNMPPMPAPQVTIVNQTPEVHVAPPTVTVEAPVVNVTVEKGGSKRVVIEQDQRGKIVGATISDAQDPPVADAETDSPE